MLSMFPLSCTLALLALSRSISAKLVNRTVDSPSPQIRYTPALDWVPVDDETHTSVADFNNGTAAKTNAIGATMTFSFNGTAIWAIGAKRWNHGSFNTSFDDGPLQTVNGYLPQGQDQYNVPVFVAENLTDGTHTLTIINAGTLPAATPQYFDLDYIIYQQTVADNETNVFYDSSDPAFQYFPQGSDWTNTTGDPKALAGTLMSSSNQNANVTFNFTGEMVELYGTLDATHGNYSCGVDGNMVMYNGTYSSTLYQQLLCTADNLSDGPHTLLLQNAPIGTRNKISVDFAIIYGTDLSQPSRSPPTGSSSSSSSASLAGPTASQSTSPSSANHGGAIAGGVVGGVLGALLISGAVYLFFFLRRRRTAKLTMSHAYQHPDMIMVEGGADSFPSGPNPQRYTSGPSSFPPPSSYSLTSGGNDLPREEDAGPLPPPPNTHRDGAVETLPPMYSPAFRTPATLGTTEPSEYGSSSSRTLGSRSHTETESRSGSYVTSSDRTSRSSPRIALRTGQTQDRYPAEKS